MAKVSRVLDRPSACRTSTCTKRLLGLALALTVTVFSCPSIALSQESTSNEQQAASTDNEDVTADLQAPKDVEIDPLADDGEIEARLTNILNATTWFVSPSVRVDEGVVFLAGQTRTADHKTWAGNLARNTQDVVAVVNRIQVVERSMWDLTPAWQELQNLGRETVQALPLLGVAIILMLLTWFSAQWSITASRVLLNRRMKNRLLVSVLSRSVAIPVFLLGLYLALRVSGLTQIAATVLGGTGLFGLILGIAFRDIAENFLASILISVQRPFAIGDKIAVEGHEGIVQSVTSRGTLLMTLDGNHVQIPNSAIYKSVIRNMTANPNERTDFVIGIDYGDSTSEAQRILLGVLKDHAAVLDKPEPTVLVDELGASTVNLRVYFWINTREHSLAKVRSSVIRLSKILIENAGLTMPDESREIIFPRGVPVIMQNQTSDGVPTKPSFSAEHPSEESAETQIGCVEAEDGLESEDREINEQARNARNPEIGENLLAT